MAVVLETDPIRVLADGTIKQTNPFSGTQVWTVPGRGHRPLPTVASDAPPIDHSLDGRHCAFCEHRYRETPPEKSRLVSTPLGWEQLDHLAADHLDSTVAEFRRVPNLFEILSLDYWQANHAHRMPDAARNRMESYLADPAGREHAVGIARAKALASGMSPERWEELPEADRLDLIENFFDGGHDVIIARRHHAPGADTTAELASSGTMDPDEHGRFIAFTVGALRDLYGFDDAVRYVSVFQNWLRPAGASFDHLHKQLVAIDEWGVRAEEELARVRHNPNLYNEMAVDAAAKHRLLLAENDHAVAFAGFGHRFPTLEVYSKSHHTLPWEHTAEEGRAISDLLHACHAATGPAVPINEEWYHQPPGLDVAMPWRILVKWRISTLAGFEGGTKINVNTISPFVLRDRILPRLFGLRETGGIAPMRLGDECSGEPGRLRYRV